MEFRVDLGAKSNLGTTPAMLNKLVDALAFWLGAFFLYWAHVIGSLIKRIRFMEFSEPRNDMFEW